MIASTMFKLDSAMPFVIAVASISIKSYYVQGICEHFYHYVPLVAGHSPPCDPSGVNIVLHCSGYYPTTSSVDLIWMWSPDTSTPYSEANFFVNFKWNPSSSTSIPTSGPYAGYYHHQTELTFTGTGVTSDVMGYYACTFVHRSASTTPQFDLSPTILITTTLGVTTPCPAYSGFSFAEYFTPDICAESGKSLSTTQPPTTFEPTSTIATITIATTTIVTTTWIATTTFDLDLAATENEKSECCGGLVNFEYFGIASVLVGSICFCLIGIAAFFLKRSIKSLILFQRRKLRKIHVDGNEIHPQTNDAKHALQMNESL